VDNPMEPTGALDLNQAAEVFGNMLEPEQEQEASEAEAEQAEVEGEELETDAAETEEESDAPEDGETITVEVDGKKVELTKEQIEEAYKNGLRQADYTRKTMEAAETRKAAEAEAQKARDERLAYSQRLTTFEAQLQGSLQEQSQINWQELIDNDPVEYLKQQHLLQQRQAQLAQIKNEQVQIQQLHEQEQAKAYQQYLTEQQQQLVAKLPSWTDEKKAAAEKAEIKGFLKESGFSDDEIASISDHRHVLLIRSAMQMQKLIKQAPDATKKVTKAPTKVERPGGGERSSADGRTAAMQRLKRSGSIDDATAVFASLL
jgi:hypothetical protein